LPSIFKRVVQRREGSAGLIFLMADDQPLVIVVILHWKNYDRTRAALKSLQRISYPNYRVTVVDNFSNDGSIENLEAEFPGSTFLQNESNLGFSRGCNPGI